MDTGSNNFNERGHWSSFGENEPKVTEARQPDSQEKS